MERNETSMKQAPLNTPGERIRHRRKQMKEPLTLAELGEKVGCSGQYIGLLERGERPFTDDLIQKISGALGISPEYIRTGRDSYASIDLTKGYENSDVIFLHSITASINMVFSFSVFLIDTRNTISVPIYEFFKDGTTFNLDSVMCMVYDKGELHTGIISKVYISGNKTTPVSFLTFRRMIYQIQNHIKSVFLHFEEYLKIENMVLNSVQESGDFASLVLEVDDLQLLHEDIERERKIRDFNPTKTDTL